MSDPIVASTLAAAKAHPARRLVWQHATWAALFGGIGLLVLAWGALAGGTAFAAIGAFFAWNAWAFRRGVREASLLNRALDACRRGEDEQAVALIEAAAARSHSRMAARTILVHRALLALETGDPKAAETHATAALEKRPGLLTADHERSQMAWAHALRGLARAALKDDAGALADAEKACDPRYATPATYEAGGRQYVVIACGGGKMGTKSSDAYVAFALPSPAK